jgi:ABC-2 type transport system permease protein
MKGVGDDLRGIAAIVRRDFLITVSYRTRFATHLLSTFFSLALFHFISRLVHVSTFHSAEDYFSFVVIGLVTLQVLNSTLQIPPGTLRGELVAGNFERLLCSPLGAVRGMLAMMVFPLLYAIATAIAMLALAGIVFGVHLRWATVALVVPVGILGAVSFAPFGVLFLATVLVAKQAMTSATFVIAGISLVAGLYFPVEVLPAWMRWLSDVQPFTPAVDLMRHVMVYGSPLHDSVAVELAKMAGFSAVLMPLSVWALTAALRWSRRRGTVLEY